MRWSEYVGKRFRGWSGFVYYAESYDPSHGFWMVNVRDPNDRHDISERAIGRTYHEIRMTWAADKLLQLIADGEPHSPEELHNKWRISSDLAGKRLFDLGYIDEQGQITPDGRAYLGGPREFDENPLVVFPAYVGRGRGRQKPIHTDYYGGVKINVYPRRVKGMPAQGFIAMAALRQGRVPSRGGYFEAVGGTIDEAVHRLIEQMDAAREARRSRSLEANVYGEGSKMPCNAVLHTSGRGLWSRKSAAVPCTQMELAYIDEDSSFGELRVYFDTTAWDVNRDGLIYTDKQWISELRERLHAMSFSDAAITGDRGGMQYSEHGMQGDNYVSLDVGGSFIREWHKLRSNPMRKRTVDVCTPCGVIAMPTDGSYVRTGRGAHEDLNEDLNEPLSPPAQAALLLGGAALLGLGIYWLVTKTPTAAAAPAQKQPATPVKQYVCGNGTVVSDPSQCPPSQTPVITQYVCPDGSTVTDPSQCPQGQTGPAQGPSGPTGAAIATEWTQIPTSTPLQQNITYRYSDAMSSYDVNQPPTLSSLQGYLTPKSINATSLWIQTPPADWPSSDGQGRIYLEFNVSKDGISLTDPSLALNPSANAHLYIQAASAG